MTSTLSALQAIQQQLIALVAPLAAAELGTQYHPDLSPLGWHLGHCAYVEAFWLQAEPQGLHRTLYAPERSSKHTRGARLPPKAELLNRVQAQQQRTVAALADPACRPRAPLSRATLAGFLLQHHAQHIEIMQQALAQRAALLHGAATGTSIQPVHPADDIVLLPAGSYRLGSSATEAYDNERPPRQVRLGPVRLARRPVRNAEYLAFMAAGGYRDRRWWSPAGWRWRTAHGAQQPEHWRRDRNGGWLLLTPSSAVPLRGDAALLGISRFEAEAYATWAGGRLPHEYEWEAAASLGLLEGIGGAWEWCGNRFHPYPGFRTFPYDGYSLPWFDGRHHVLRGASPYTLSCLRRASFRNFYTPEKRHVFAGCRLAFDA